MEKDQKENVYIETLKATPEEKIEILKNKVKFLKDNFGDDVSNYYIESEINTSRETEEVAWEILKKSHDKYKNAQEILKDFEKIAKSE